MSKENTPQKLLFLVAEPGYFCSHRLNLAKAAIKAGYEVALATRIDPKGNLDPKTEKSIQKIKSAGIHLFPLSQFRRADINPWQQILAYRELVQIYQSFKPDIVHHVALKPVVLGTLVALRCKVKRVINALGGLGFVFSAGGIKKRILRSALIPVLRFLFSRSQSILILQNQDDLDTLVQAGCIQREQVELIRGAGVDIDTFKVSDLPSSPPFIIAAVTRMLWDKGIGELVDAALILKAKQIPAKILLYGTPDPENPRSLQESELQKWHDQGIVEYKGYCEEVPVAYANCHIAVLPSYYREGLPKTLLEAASCGRPIITTDFPGCREAVIHGKNGWLIPPRNSHALADALIELIENESLRHQMGKEGRKLVEENFADHFIHDQTLKLYK